MHPNLLSFGPLRQIASSFEAIERGRAATPAKQLRERTLAQDYESHPNRQN